MTAPVTLRIDGDRRLLDMLRGVRERARDTRPVMKLMAAYMLEIAHKAFTQQAEPETGKRWAPLTDRTLKGKYLGRVRSSYTGGAPLRRTGMLMNSIAPLDLQADTVAVGTTIPYGLFHNSAPASPRRRFPRRQFLAWPPEAQGVFGELIAEHFGRIPGVEVRLS